MAGVPGRTEEQKKKARKKAHAEGRMSLTPEGEPYRWAPFEPGNAAHFTHGGGDSPGQMSRMGQEKAQEIAERLLDGNCPEQLRWPQFLPAVQAWSRLEARALLLSNWLDGMTPEEMSMPAKAGGATPAEVWMAAERSAGRARERLGLDPASYAKIAKDLGIAGRAADDAVTRLGHHGALIREKRASVRVLKPADDGDESGSEGDAG
jgi:hypothetical protein